MARPLLVLLLTLCFSGTARADAASLRVDRLLAAADRDLTRGELHAAEQRLARGLVRDAGDPRLLLRYAELALPLDGALAASELTQLEARARQFVAALARAEADSRLGSLDAEHARRILLHAAWASALIAAYEQAFAQLVAAGRLQDRPTIDCLRQLASLFVRREQLVNAERALRMARQYMPQDMQLATELGQVLLARGSSASAVTVLAERFAVDPQNLEARRDFAYALTAAGRADDGYALFASERAACSQLCALEAARVALEAGRTADARTHAERRLAEAPDDLDALFVAADAHTRAGEFDAARGVYDRLLALRPDSVRAKLALEQLPAAAQRAGP